MAKIKVNSNFHSVTQKSVFDTKHDAIFKEYRRRWHEFPKNFVAGNFPIHLDIESTSICNLRCPFCAVTWKNWGSSEKGFMGLDLYKRIIDEGLENELFSIKLSLRGEPLLHKGLSKMVAYAKDKGIVDVYFNTNAIPLTEKIINELIDAKLDRISISVEGTSPSVYEKYRVGARFEKVLKNIRLLSDIREKRVVDYPQIRIQTVLLPEFKDSFDKYVKFWKPYADEVAYLDARQEAGNENHRGRIADWACPFLWQRMVILWDGTLLPCLMHGVSDFYLMAFGNINDVSIKDTWQGEKENYYRELHKQRESHRLLACDQCSYRAMEIEKLEVKS